MSLREALDRLRARWPRPVEFALFCAVGGSGVIVDYAVLVPLVALAHLDARLAAVAAFVVAVSWNYALNRRLTFSGARQLDVRRSYTAFVAVCAVGVGIRVGVMHAIMVSLGWRAPPRVYLTSFLGIVAATAWNFAGAKLFVFRSNQTPGRTASG
jgi:putative flippase GtrA